MTEIAPNEQADSATMLFETDAELPENQSGALDQRRRYFAPNRSLVQDQETAPASYVQVSTDIEVAADIGAEGYHNRSAAPESEWGRFQETRLLTPHEVRRRAYAALRRAEIRREALREEEAKYTDWTDD